MFLCSSHAHSHVLGWTYALLAIVLVLIPVGDVTAADYQFFGRVTDQSGNPLARATVETTGIWTWGRNTYGQLGDGTTTNQYTPIEAPTMVSDVVGIAAGYYQSYILKADGAVWAWERNNFGQIGDGTTTDRPAPVQVLGIGDVTDIAAGSYLMLAIKSDNTVWSWGLNNFGQLGDGTTASRSVPAQVSGLTDIIAVSGGGVHSLALKSDGTVWAWGYNSEGQLGDGTPV